jgi:thiamine kinase-like enzyme
VETTERAVSAALAVARAQGIRSVEPRVVRDLTNVLVHLAPAPMVARVPITLARLRPPSWYVQEVELGAFLDRAGAPVVPPAADVDPGPHQHDGFLVSLWTYVEHDAERFEAEAVGRSLRDLHEALAGYRGKLPTCDRLEEVGSLLMQLRPSSVVTEEELAGLRREQQTLAAQPRPGGRPIHGDSHERNVLWGTEGPLWTDLENACSGPIEYDLACIAWRGGPSTDAILAAYGNYDEAAVERLEPYLALFLAAWTIVIAERRPFEGSVAEARRRIARALSGES